jgi:preprotein translocase subunit SecY
MPSAAERLASNFNLSVLGKAQELKKRLWFVIGAMIVARIGAYIPIPGIDPQVLNLIFKQYGNGVLGMFNMFSGGSLGRMTIFALGILPYISASIILQVLTIASPHLAALKKEGEAGRRKINQYTRYGTVLLALMQGYGIAAGLEHMGANNMSAVIAPGIFFRVTTAVTLLGGTMFLMWLGEQMTARGIGNGISLIIFAGIVANFPSALGHMFEQGRTGSLSPQFILLIVALALALVAFIVFIERAQRRILVNYPKRQVGMKMMGGESSHLPLRLNTAGVIPPIFASSILLFPLMIANFGQYSDNWYGQVTLWITTHIARGTPLYLLLYVLAVVFFSFFYTSIQFNTQDTADNLKKYGGFIPGIRPGKTTADYLDYVLTRLTMVGAIYLAFVCVLPEIMISRYNVPFQLGGTSLLITVNVLMDFVAQVQSHLFAHQYEGLIKKSRLKGKR